MCFVLLIWCARYTKTVLQIRIKHPDVAKKGISGMMLIALSQFNATVINFIGCQRFFIIELLHRVNITLLISGKNLHKPLFWRCNKGTASLRCLWNTVMSTYHVGFCSLSLGKLVGSVKTSAEHWSKTLLFVSERGTCMTKEDVCELWERGSGLLSVVGLRKLWIDGCHSASVLVNLGSGLLLLAERRKRCLCTPENHGLFVFCGNTLTADFSLRDIFVDIFVSFKLLTR